MSDLVVRPVGSRGERRAFLEFPWRLYRDDPHWIPPLRVDQKEMVGYRPHPFYRRNAVQTFLAYRSGEVCGRIAAILNRDHNEHYSERRGFFGFFECVDDEEAAAALFDAVRQWFAGNDIHCLRGPTNPSLNYTLGLLVDGFHSPPTFMMTYNPAYYARLFEAYGFRKAQDLYAYLGQVEMLPRVRERWEPVVQQIIEHYNVRLRPLDTSRFVEDVEAFLSVYNRSLVSTWGFVPMSGEEVRHMARSLRLLLVPELAVGAEIDGRLVGATLCLPDYNPRIKAIDGRLFPFGFIRLLRKKDRIKKVRTISTNVLPEYHRMGLGLALMHGLAPRGIEWGVEEMEFSWILESNTLSWKSLAKAGTIRDKTYRVYDLGDE